MSIYTVNMDKLPRQMSSAAQGHKLHVMFGKLVSLSMFTKYVCGSCQIGIKGQVGNSNTWPQLSIFVKET